MHILVVGGAGYIGSHMVHYLLERNFSVTVFDNFSTGHRDAVPAEVELHPVDLLDLPQLMTALAKSKKIAAVLHFAGLSLVNESVTNPEQYYRNNVLGTANLLTAMRAYGLKNIVFSSTASVYGCPQMTPLAESHPTQPVNPYGRTKLIVEQMLQDYATTYGFNVVSLRYFNAAGADVKNKLGERHHPETHLIPLVLQAAQQKKSVHLYGKDYPTPDGTCVRDYIHVLDLCAAHLLALKIFATRPGFHLYNLGTSKGVSVLEIIKAAEKITQLPIQVEVVARRMGDPAILVADATLATQELGWQPCYSAIEQIITDVWMWQQLSGRSIISH